MNRLMQAVALVTVAVLAAPPGVGAPAKKAAKSAPARKRAAPAAKPPVEDPLPPVVARLPGEMMTPALVALRETTPAEDEANAVWNFRAALNIAALQCQYSPFLATVSTYNAVLRQHADELDRARSTMLKHFRRYDGKAAQNSFDQYTTRTYNSYSTLDAQYALCEKSAMVGREALTIRKGELGVYAARINPEIRAALVPVHSLTLLGSIDDLVPVELPPL